MHLDEKVTIWGRYHLPQNTDLEKLKQNLASGMDIEEALTDVIPEHEDYTYEYLLDTSEALFPEENDNQPTIELWDETGPDVIWSNEIK